MDTDPKFEAVNLACTQYEPLLEDSLDGQLDAARAKSVTEHARSCAACRSALDEAEAASRFLRVAGPLLDRADDPGPAFSRIVMARIRAEAGRSEEKSIWQPFVSFGWRFAISASLALALLIGYATTSQPSNQKFALAQRTEARDLFSDPSTNPITRGEVLLVVAENKNARQ
jgi:hypothetical protein